MRLNQYSAAGGRGVVSKCSYTCAWSGRDDWTVRVGVSDPPPAMSALDGTFLESTGLEVRKGVSVGRGAMVGTEVQHPWLGLPSGHRLTLRLPGTPHSPLLLSSDDCDNSDSDATVDDVAEEAPLEGIAKVES